MLIADMKVLNVFEGQRLEKAEFCRKGTFQESDGISETLWNRSKRKACGEAFEVRRK
jgi:hypothetical protein